MIDGSRRLFLSAHHILQPSLSPFFSRSATSPFPSFLSGCAHYGGFLSLTLHPAATSRSVWLTASRTLEVTATLSFVTRVMTRQRSVSGNATRRAARRCAARRHTRLIRRTATINSRISAPARFHACPSCRKSSR